MVVRAGVWTELFDGDHRTGIEVLIWPGQKVDGQVVVMYVRHRPAAPDHPWQEYNAHGNTCQAAGCTLTKQQHVDRAPLPPAEIITVSSGGGDSHTFPIESTAYAEVYDDQAAAYRDEPGLTR